MKTDTYLSHCYVIPETPPILPLADEAFVTVWKEAEGIAVKFSKEKEESEFIDITSLDELLELF